MEEGALVPHAAELALQQREVCLEQPGAALEHLHHLLRQKAACAQRAGEIAARSAAQEAERDKAALGRVVAERELDLSKSKVDLLRWRQRAALLKMQLSSAEEDVKRYQRVSDILRRQYELERAAKLTAQENTAAQRHCAAAVDAAAAEQAREGQGLRTELDGMQAVLAERQRQLMQLQQELAATSQREGELEQRLEALQTQRAQLEQQLTAAEGRAAALQQEVTQLKQQRFETEAAAVQQQAFVEQLQLQAEQLRQEVAAKDSEIALLRQRASAEGQLAADLKARLAQLEAKLAAKRERISELEEQAAQRTIGVFVSQLESPAAAVGPMEGMVGGAGEADAAARGGSAWLATTEPHVAMAQPEPAAPAVAQDKKKPAANNAQGQRKRKSKRGAVEEQEEADVAGREIDEDGGGAAEPPRAAGRPRRERSKSAPYWMAQSAPALPPAEGGDSAGQNGAGSPPAAAPELEAAVAEENQGELQLAAGGEEALAEERQQQPGKDGGRRRGRGGSQAEQPAMEEAAEEAPMEEAKAPKGRGRKAQLKRPQGEIKTNLTNVWGGATPVPGGSEDTQQGSKTAKLPRKSNLGPKPAAQLQKGGEEAAEAAGSSQHRHAPSAAPADENDGGSREALRGSQGAQQQEVTSRTQERQLAALNHKTLAAAANRLHRPLGTTKATLQKAIAVRGEQSQQPQKRKLLSVTTAYATTAGDAVPTASLFGGQFKVPRLAK